MAGRRSWRRAVLIGVLTGLLTWVVLLTITVALLPVSGGPSPGYGCLNADREKTVEVGEVVIVEADVRYGECTGAVPGPDDPSGFEKTVELASRARVQLVSPLFPGEIAPISEEVLPIADERGGHWAWEVRPAQPGDQHVSLVLSWYDGSGETIEGQERRIDVVIHSKSTAAYHLDSFWNGVQGFVTSAVGVVTGVASVVGILAAALTRFRRRDEPTPPPDRDGGDRGYL